jgi:cytoskeletal protein RodZ
MPTRSLALLLVGLAAVLIVIVLSLSRQNPPATSPDSLSPQSGTTTHTNSEPATHGSLRSRERDKDQSIAVDEMIAALNSPLPGLTKFPEQTLQERILAANASLKKAGNVVRFDVDEKMHPSQILLERTLPAFSQENATPNDILRDAQRTLKQHHLLDEDRGRVLFQEGSGG